MTNLSDFLKVKKVRCVSIGNYKFITVGKEYDVVGLTRNSVFIVNDDESENIYPYKHFKPVLDSAENPLQDMKLTPEFEALDKPKFNLGDPVYFPRLSNKLCVIDQGQEDDYVDEVNGSKALAEMQSDLDFVYDQKTKSWLWNEKDCAPQLLHATPENYELLSKLHPHIKFEQPPKELKGSDLARAMVDKGWFIVDCYVSAISDEDALRFRNKRMQVALFGDGLFTDGVKQFPFAVPFDSKTGEPLTESILND